MHLGGLKSFLSQVLIRRRLAPGNQFGKHIRFSKDVSIGKNCRIGEDVCLSEGVIIGDSVIVNSNCVLSRISIGNYSCIEYGVICTGSGMGRITIGENSYIGIYNILDWSAEIVIGDYVQIAGPTTALWTHSGAKMSMSGIALSNHDTKHRPRAPITIESYVYIGGNCTLYPGVKVSHHSIIAPNSAVTKDVPPYTMVGGVPARMIKELRP